MMILGLILAIACVLLFIAYLVFNPATVVKTTEIQGASGRGDLFYYLPTAGISVKVTLSGSGDLSIENEVPIVPDTTRLFALTYTPSVFMSDEIKWTTNDKGLLETVAIITEDKLPDIYAQLPGATAKLIVPGDHTQTFYISPEDISLGKAVRNWTAGGQNMSLSVSFEGLRPAAVREQTEVAALLTRPLVSVKMITSVAGSNFEHHLLLPDHSRLLQVPLTRARFVKKVYKPQFKSGILVENYIDKPSQSEGLAKIPINIGKAIFSIPSELFNFRVTQKKVD